MARGSEPMTLHPKRPMAQPENTRAEPMTFTVTRQPSIHQERVRAAMLARDESASMEDLKSAAASAGVSTSGLRSREQVSGAILTATAPPQEG